MSRDLSHETRELLVLARGDAPTPKSRDNMWDGLEKAILPAAVGIGTVAAAAKPVATIATNPTAWVPQAAAVTAKPGIGAVLASAKLAIGGALVGTAVVLSVVTGVVRQRMAPQLAADADPRPTITYEDSVVSFNAPAFPAQLTGSAAPSPATLELTPKEESLARAARAVPRVSVTSSASSDDTLLREASLVSEARSALLRGDPQTALVSVQAARREGRNLEPEELSIEARALRALGREPEAAQLDTTLRSRYPNHALARVN